MSGRHFLLCSCQKICHQCDLMRIFKRSSVFELLHQHYTTDILPLRTSLICWSQSKVKNHQKLSVIVYICLRLSECMNPFLYNMASTKMRKASVRAIGQMLYCICRYRWGVWRRQETRIENNRTERSLTNCRTNSTTTGTGSYMCRIHSFASNTHTISPIN